MIEQDLGNVYRGARKVFTFTVEPVRDIGLGWSLVFTAARSKGSSTKDITQAGAVVNGPAGIYSVTLSAAQTDIRPGVLFFDCWRTDPGLSEPLATGTLTLVDVVRLP